MNIFSFYAIFGCIPVLLTDGMLQFALLAVQLIVFIIAFVEG